MRPLLLSWTALAGCAGAQQTLRFAPTPSETPVRCTVEVDRDLPLCTDDQRELHQTWRSVPGFGQEDHARFVAVGDAGLRLGAVPDPGALAVASSARAVCRGTCDALLFLGDNVYWNGVDEGAAGDVARHFLDDLADTYDQPHVYFTLGNHDWGPTTHDRDRAQRELAVLREDDAAGDRFRGDAHFWQADAGPARLVSLDTDHLVHDCHGDDVRCRSDRDGTPLRDAVRTALSEAPAPIVLGHHPWASNGHHGSAGRYRDLGPISLGRGEALRALLDDVVAPASPLYLSGHDHATQVHLEGGTLSLVLGAGAAATPPAKHPGETLAFEDWCRLGFAVVDATPDTLAVQVYTLNPPDTKASSDDRHGCRDVLAKREPGPGSLPGQHVAESLPGTDLRCVRFEKVGEAPWSPDAACVGFAPPARPVAPEGSLGFPAEVPSPGAQRRR